MFTLPFSRPAFSTLATSAFLLLEIFWNSAKKSELRDRSASGWEEYNSVASRQIQTGLVNLKKL